MKESGVQSGRPRFLLVCICMWCVTCLCLWKGTVVLGLVDLFALPCLSTSLPSCWDMYCVDSWQIFFLSFPFCFDHRKKLVKGGELLHSLVHLPICSTTEVHYRTFAMLTYSRAVRPQQCRGLRSATHLKRVRSCWLCTNDGVKLCACSGDIRYIVAACIMAWCSVLCNKRDKLQGPPEPDTSATSFGDASKSNRAFQ